MDLAFVIPAYNEQQLIGKCLEFVLAEVKRSGRKVDIVVVNNASTDKTREIALGYEGVRVVDEMEKGIVAARDAGLRATTAELVANIDADTVVPKGWIDVVLSEFDRNQKLVALSGPYFYYDLSAGNRLIVTVFYGVTFFIYLMSRFVFRRGSVVQGGNFVFKRSAWLAAGGYDRSIKFYGEDTDVAMRLARIGPVKWTYKLKMWTTGRRLIEEGVIKTGATYAINFFSVVLSGRPATKKYTDVRPESADR